MSDVTDVVAVKLRDARVGDWLVDCRDGVLVATIESLSNSVLRARFEQVPSRAWNWDLDERVDLSRDTLPAMQSLKAALAIYGIRIGPVLEIVRPL
jgi:hypothetical protein